MMAQRFAVYVLTGNKMNGIRLSNLEDGQDVGMIQGGRRFGFLNKTLQSRLISRDILRQDLQCDGTLELRVIGEIYLAHPACTDLRANLISAKFCASRKRETHRNGFGALLGSVA